MSILNKYKRWVPMLVTDTSNQLDMVLSQDHTPSIDLDGSLNEDCLISFIDMTNEDCVFDDGVYSLTGYSYEKAVAEDCQLTDIRLTGLDNGLIDFEKLFGTYEISNKQFYRLMNCYEMWLNSGDTRLTLYNVTGNTGYHSYGTYFIKNDENNETYYAFKGGFLQGFYKMYGYDYQTLPQYIENTWNLEFVIRPHDYTQEADYQDKAAYGKQLNEMYPENKGIFFYMGTRAENKFAQFYSSTMKNYPIRDNYKELCPDSMNGKYIHEENQETQEEMERRHFIDDLWLVWSLYRPFEYGDGMYKCGCRMDTNYNEVIDSIKKENNSCRMLSDYVEDDLDLSEFSIDETSEGKPIDTNKFLEITTDNKYLLFNHTHNGFTTHTFDYDPDVEYVLTGTVKEYKTNQYLLFNHTKNGYTTHNIGDYFDSDEYKNSEVGQYDINKDTVGNAFALKVNDDGSVGYRYMVKDCDAASGYAIEEEYSYSGIVQQDEWNVINVMFCILNGSTDKCGVPLGRRRMKIYIYVNGYLKMVSKELPELYFHELDDTFDKQEGVPFNLSLGGGSQGLLESIWTNRKEVFKYILPIEQNFAGTFIGDMRSFKFYNCKMEWAKIHNNYLYEIGGEKKKETTVENTKKYFAIASSPEQVILSGDSQHYDLQQYSIFSTKPSTEEAHFIFVISENYLGKKPAQFICGGIEMVMSKESKIINGQRCIVYTSEETYPAGTNLTITTINI